MINKKYLSIGLIVFSVTMMGCTPKDKQIIASNDVSGELQLQGKDVNESIELGNDYLKQGKYDDAKKAYENAISKDPTNKQNYLDIKDKYVEKSRFDDAFYIIKLAVNNKVDIDNMNNILEEIKKNFQVISLEDTVYQNDKFTLPGKVDFKVNEQQIQGDVNWNISDINTSKVGTFTYEGTIDQYGRTVNQKLIVTAKKVVDNSSTATSEEVYKNEKLGFSIKFPDSWKGKYTVKESDDGIRVYFKPNNNRTTLGAGFLFGVIKKSADLDESTFDTVSYKMRYFDAKGITYVIGGPSDVNFSDTDPEYNIFQKMSKEAKEVVQTLKSL